MSSAADTFWKKIEQVTGNIVPHYIKFALKLQKVDDPISLKESSAKEIFELEKFIASQKYENLILPNSDLMLYYGDYHSSSSRFRFSETDKKTIEKFMQVKCYFCQIKFRII